MKKQAELTLEPTKIWIEIDGIPQQVEALNKTKSAEYLGITATALQGVLKRYPDIKTYTPRVGRDVYLLVSDLDDLRAARECPR
jgi:hypothetical protein